jgi:hypothetical protein
MNPNQTIALASICLCLSIFSSQPIQAQTQNPCPVSTRLEPDTQTREIKIEKFGATFKIPANYKTRTDANGTDLYVRIYEPSAYELLNCTIKNNIPSEDRLEMLVINLGQAEPGRSLVDIANAKYGFRNMKIANVKNVTINNRPAITYTHKVMGIDEYIGALFTSPNQKSFIGFSYYPATNSITTGFQKTAEEIIASMVLKPAESPKYPNNAEMQGLRTKFDRGIKRVESDRTGAGYVRDRRTESDKQSLESFSQAWAKIDPTIVPFLGSWSGYEHGITVYPSASKSKVCIVTSGEGIGNVQVSEIHSGLLRYYPDFFLWRQGRYLGMGRFDGNTSGFPSDIPHNNPRPLEAIEAFLSQRIVDSSNREEMVRSFHEYGCTSDLPK